MDLQLLTNLYLIVSGLYLLTDRDNIPTDEVKNKLTIVSLTNISMGILGFYYMKREDKSVLLSISIYCIGSGLFLLKHYKEEKYKPHMYISGMNILTGLFNLYLWNKKRQNIPIIEDIELDLFSKE